MLLRDYDHQFARANLGEAFGIDSTYEDTTPNAYDFHLLLFHEGLTKIEVSAEIHASRASGNTIALENKFARKGGGVDGVIKNTPYPDLVSKAQDRIFYSPHSRALTRNTITLRMPSLMPQSPAGRQ